MSELNLFIDVGNVSRLYTSDSLPASAHIALIKNMEHVKSVFILANKDNVLKTEVSKLADSDVVKDEYAAGEPVGFNEQLATKPGKIVIYDKRNNELIEKLNDTMQLNSLAKNALLIEYNSFSATETKNDENLDEIFSLFTDKYPKLGGIKLSKRKVGTERHEEVPLTMQLYADKGDNLEMLNHIIKDAAAMRGITINLMNQGQKGGLFGLFKTKTWDELATDIAKKVEKKDKKYVGADGNADMTKIMDAINNYYGLDKIKEKETQKYYTALDNYKSALNAVKSMLLEKSNTPKALSSMKKRVKVSKHSELQKVSVSSKSPSKKESAFKKVVAQKIHNNKYETFQTSEYAGIIISNKKFMDKFKDSKVPVIYYDSKSLPILNTLLTAQFHVDRLRKVFATDKGTKKAGLFSGVKKLYSKATRKNLDRVHAAREASEARMLKKVKEAEIKDYRRNSFIRGKFSGRKISYNDPKVMELKTKKEELKKMGFALFKKTKKKQLQANIATLEQEIAENKKAAAKKKTKSSSATGSSSSEPFEETTDQFNPQ